MNKTYKSNKHLILKGITFLRTCDSKNTNYAFNCIILQDKSFVKESANIFMLK